MNHLNPICIVTTLTHHCHWNKMKRKHFTPITNEILKRAQKNLLSEKTLNQLFVCGKLTLKCLYRIRYLRSESIESETHN